MTNFAMEVQRDRSFLLSKLDTPVAHLVGIAIFLACMTPVPGLLLVKFIGEVPIRAFQPFLLVAFFLLLLQNRVKSGWMILPLIVSLIGFAGYFINRNELANLVGDAQGFLDLIAAAIIFASIESTQSLKVILRYFIVCLWLSAIVCLLIYTGRLENIYGFRSSFSGSGVSDIGLGRLLTPTFVPAEVALCLAFVGFLQGWRNRKILLLATVPAVAILLMAGARTVILVIAIPLVFSLFSGRRREIAKRVGKSVLVAGGFFLLSGLILSAIGAKTENAISYVVNTIIRASVFFTNSDLAQTDDSSFYRFTEIRFAWDFINRNLFFGGGYGVAYSNQPFVADGSWLANHGNVYLHETYLFLLVKVGIVGLVALIVWLIMELRTLIQTELYLVFLQTFLVFVCISFVWNLVANVPDSLVFGALIGLVRANVRRKSLTLEGKDLQSSQK